MSLTQRMRSTEARFALLIRGDRAARSGRSRRARGVKQLTKPGNLVAPQPCTTVVTLKD